MPYFYKPEINLNLLFIHIPKTGGSSLEKYFSNKYNIPLHRDSLVSTLRRGITPNSISFQHQPYSMLLKHKDFFNIHFTPDIKIISIVRNPYERIISDLFHLKLININTSREEVFQVINRYLVTDIVFFDNHQTPQYQFIVDENNNFIKNMTILKMEQLNSDMYDLGYNDFKEYEQTSKEKVNYYNYLNKDSIQLINNHYEKDFLYFGYKMK